MKVRYWRNGEVEQIEGKLLNFLECIEAKADNPEYWITYLEGPRAGLTIGVAVSPIVRADNGWIV